MLSDNFIRISNGRITRFVSENTSIIAVIEFVEGVFPEFVSKATSLRVEDKLTLRLVDILDLRSRRESVPFRFRNQDIQSDSGKSPKVDIGVRSDSEEGITIDTIHYSTHETFFSLEAKRLFSPPKNRQKEYLIGKFEKDPKGEAIYRNTGGVERFKKRIHGSRLNYSAIIGYVQESNFSQWHSRINSWIDELINPTEVTEVEWTEEDKLVEQAVENQSNTFTRYKSLNKRTSGEPITLYHLWVNLC